MSYILSRRLAGAGAALLALAAQAQTPSQTDLDSAPAEVQLLYCSLTNLEKIKDSRESAEAVAIAALSMCSKERGRILAENSRSLAQWEYHRQIALDRLIGIIVQRRLNNPQVTK